MELVEFSVVVDYDGVLACNQEVRGRYAREVYGIRGLSSPIKREFVVNTGIMTQEQYRRLQLEVSGFWKWVQQMKPIKGVTSVVPFLHREGVQLSIVTSKTDEIVSGVHYGLLSMAKQWLAKYDLLQYFQEIKGVGYRKSKAPVIAEFEPRPLAFMDDDLGKLLLARGIVENLFLFSQPHNLNKELPSDVGRIDSWWHFEDVIYQLKSAILVG